MTSEGNQAADHFSQQGAVSEGFIPAGNSTNDPQASQCKDLSFFFNLLHPTLMENSGFQIG